jgi:hypothetical protein
MTAPTVDRTSVRTAMPMNRLPIWPPFLWAGRHDPAAAY